MVGIPQYKWVGPNDIDDDGMIAAWQKPGGLYPNGCVYLDKEHPVIVSQIEYWQSKYPRAVSPQVKDIVMDAYADVAVAKAAHLHALTGTVLSDNQRDSMLANPALSTSMLGLIAEDALISPRLGGLGAKQKKTGAAEETAEGKPDESTPAA